MYKVDLLLGQLLEHAHSGQTSSGRSYIRWHEIGHYIYVVLLCRCG